MQCGECGASIAEDISFCPSCGARQATPVPSVRMAGPRPGESEQVGDAEPAHPLSSASQAVNAPLVSILGRAPKPVKAGKSALPQAGETFANRYRVEKYLGLGALCNTYLCRDLGASNQEVVVKIMHARKAAEAGLAESFLFLAESVAKYDHKGIAKILASGRHEGIPYYAMEWVGGVPLRLWMMERLNLENRVLPGLGLIGSLLDTFEAIHERGCYGCLKPENVFVTLNGPVVTDFGVVGFLSPQEFEFNSYARRYLPYMAPELRQDWSNLLPLSDFFSVGAILYEILVGRAPASQLRLPSELGRIFGIEADEIILKSMAIRPSDRFGNPQDFKNAVLSLQSSLLHARLPGEIPPSPLLAEKISPVAPAPPNPSILEVSTDLHTLHNPEEAFSADDLPRGILPPSLPPRLDGSLTEANPWIRERAASPDEGALAGSGPVQAPSEPQSSPVFPQATVTPAPDGDEGEKTLSAFADLGDRIVEEAHAQRRFTGPGPGLAHAGPAAAHAVPDSLRRVPAAALEREESSGTGARGGAVSDEKPFGGESPVLDAEILEEDEAEPVPAWLWISIALAGCCMVVLSAYFGLLHPN